MLLLRLSRACLGKPAMLPHKKEGEILRRCLGTHLDLEPLEPHGRVRLRVILPFCRVGLALGADVLER